MNSQYRSLLMKRLWAVAPITIVINAVGAVCTFVYFAVVEAGLTWDQSPEELSTRFAIFALLLSVVMTGATVLGILICYPLGTKLAAKLDSRDHSGIDRLLGHLMNVPLYMTGLSLFGWLAATLIFTFFNPWFELAYGGSVWTRVPVSNIAFRVASGMLFVGTPFSLVFVYLGVESWIRRTLHDIALPDLLVQVPPAIRVSVLPKMIIAILMVGIPPVVLLGLVSLGRIYDIGDGNLEMADFLERMPAVILFLSGVAVIESIGLAALMARSISVPMSNAVSVTAKVRDGDLNVMIPVLSHDEIGAMAEEFNDMIEGLRERERIRETFGEYVSSDVAAEILTEPFQGGIGGELRDVTVLVTDIRGFTPMTESMDPRHLVQLINSYLEKMIEIIYRYEGTINDFTGDGILAFFGAPRAYPDHTRRAVTCAVEMQRAMVDLNRANEALGRRAIQMGIGIQCGELVVGTVGSKTRKKYTVMGSAINVAFRVEAQTKGGEVLITPEVLQRIGDTCRIASSRECRLKGIDTPVILHSVAVTGSGVELEPKAGEQRFSPAD